VSSSPQRAAIERSPAIAVSVCSRARGPTRGLRPRAGVPTSRPLRADTTTAGSGLVARAHTVPAVCVVEVFQLLGTVLIWTAGDVRMVPERGSLRSVAPALTHRAFATILVTSVTACASNGTPGTPSVPDANPNCCPCRGQDNQRLCCGCGPYSPNPPQPPQPPQEVTVGGNASSQPACTDVGPMLSDAGTCPDGYQQVSISCCAPCVGTCLSDRADSGIDVRVESAAGASRDAPPDASKDSTADASGPIDASNATD
jgi:hypothetical protein